MTVCVVKMAGLMIELVAYEVASRSVEVFVSVLQRVCIGTMLVCHNTCMCSW